MLEHPRRVAGDRAQHLLGVDDAAAGLARRPPRRPRTSMPGDLGLLVDLDAALVGAAGVAPGDGVVARDGAGRMVQRAQDRRVRRRSRGRSAGTSRLMSSGADHLAVDAEVLVDLGPPAHGAQRGVGVRQREVAALGIEQVEVEVLGQVLRTARTLSS